MNGLNENFCAITSVPPQPLSQSHIYTDTWKVFFCETQQPWFVGIKHSVAFMQTHYQIPCLKSTSPNPPSFRSSLEKSYLCRLRMLPRFLYRAMPVTNVEASSGSALGKKQRYRQGLTWDLAHGRNSKNELRDLQRCSSKQS